MERRAAMCGGRLEVEVESSGEREELGLRGEGTRGRDHSRGLKTMGSNVGLRFAGRLLKLSGLTGNGGRGIAHGAGVAVAVAVAVDWEPWEPWAPWELEQGIRTLKRGVIDPESFRTRGRSRADAGSGAGSDTGPDTDASCSGSSSGSGVGVGRVGVSMGSADSAGVGSSTGN